MKHRPGDPNDPEQRSRYDGGPDSPDRKKKKGRSGGGTGGGDSSDDDDDGALRRQLNAVTAERDLLKMKLSSSERENAKLKEDLAKLQRELNDKNGELAALQQRLDDAFKQLADLEKELMLKGGGPKGKKGKKGQRGEAGDGPDGKNKKKGKGGADGVGGADGDGGEEGDEDEDEDFADKCVGTEDLVKDDWDHFKQVRGKHVGPGRERNTHGRAFIREVRSFPDLHQARSLVSAAVKDPSEEQKARDMIIAPPRAGAPRKARDLPRELDPLAGATHPGVGWPMGKGSFLNSTPFATTAYGGKFGKAVPNLGAGLEAEPYLVKVWDHIPAGHKQPVAPELIQLGAISPRPRSGKQADAPAASPKDLAAAG